MPCPCGKTDHPELAGRPYHLGLPRDCWLFANDAARRAYWNGELPAQPTGRRAAGAQAAPAPAVPCRHLGRATGETRECPSCQGTVSLKLFACAVFGVCTTHKAIDGTACCRGCPRYEPPA